MNLAGTRLHPSPSTASVSRSRSSMGSLAPSPACAIMPAVPWAKAGWTGDYVVCPWHNWKYHRRTGLGEPGYEDDAAPSYEVRLDNGHLFLNLEPATKRTRGHHDPHPLARKVVREPGPVRVVGISTTAMDANNPRFSSSDALLEVALAKPAAMLGTDTRLIKLTISRSATARATTRRAPTPAPGPARSRRWIRPTRWSRSTRHSCTGPTSS